MDKSKIDLTAPAFGQGSQKLEDLAVKAEAVAPKVEQAPKEEEPPTSEEESKVPYSRFKKFHEKAGQYERENLELRTQLEQIKHQSVSKSESELPDFWVELYGDSEASKKAWKIQSQQNETLIKQAEERALEAVRNERGQEEARIAKNMEALDTSFETLTDFVGRGLTDKEQSAVLDIVDEYTPKDEHGNYAGAFLPFEKAWEIYELKTSAEKAPKAKARDQVASLTGTPSEGNPTVSEADKNFNPLDWGAYKRRLGI